MKRKSLLVAAVLATSAMFGGTVATAAQAATTAPVAKATARAAQATPATPQLGVQMHATWEMYWNGTTPNAMFTKHLDALAANHVQVLRVDMGWSAGQPTAAAPSMGDYHNKRLAIIVDRVRAKGMKLFLTVHQSPAWSRPGTDRNNTKQYPTNPAAIKPYMGFLAKNLGSRLAGIEVWNEPNLVEFTGVESATARPAKYVALLKNAYAAIKAADPKLPVIFGGTAQTDDTFVRQAYAAGAKGNFDVMAVHPYQGNQTKAPESTDITGKSRMTNLPAIVAAMAANGDSAKPIWWTEFGTSVHSNTGIKEVWRYGVASDQIAADYLVRSFKLAAAKYPQVKVGVVYVAYKPAEDAYGHQYGYRLLDANGTVHAQLKALGAMRVSTPSR